MKIYLLFLNKMKICGQFSFFFFLTQNGNETNPEIKKKQPITIQQIPANLLSFASLNQPQSCSSVSVAMEKDYIILEWRVERRKKKKKGWWQKRDWHRCLEYVMPQIIVIEPIFSMCFRREYIWQLLRNLKTLKHQKCSQSKPYTVKPLVNDHLQ